MNGKQWYAEKLKDPRWQKRRLEIMGRDNFTCQGCGDTTSMLSVHHKAYWKSWSDETNRAVTREPWDYPDSALVTLCEDCHEAERELIEEAMHDISLMLRRNYISSEIHSLMSSILYGIECVGEKSVREIIENTLYALNPRLESNDTRGAGGPSVPGIPPQGGEGGGEESHREGAGEG